MRLQALIAITLLLKLGLYWTEFQLLPTGSSNPSKGHAPRAADRAARSPPPQKNEPTLIAKDHQ